MSPLFLLVPPLGILAAFLLRDRLADPVLAIIANGICPGSGLVLLRRSGAEVILALTAAEAALLIGVVARAFFPSIVVGVASAVWAGVYADLDSGTRERVARWQPPEPSVGDRAVQSRSSLTVPGSRREPERTTPSAPMYTVDVTCTECGADVSVPVLHRMARCEYCGSRHLVVGRDEVLQLSLPDRINGQASLKKAVLDHFRYRYYVKLYQRHVAPLIQRGEYAETGGALMQSQQSDLAAAAADRQINRRADTYRRRLENEVEVVDSSRFLAPYWHGLGTFCQTAFGRDRDSLHKKLVFTLDSLEASRPAFDALELPAMGRLSYLRALRSAAAEKDTPVVPVTVPRDGLKDAFGDLDRKRLVRSIDVIRHGWTFTDDAVAVVWRPWWRAVIRGADVDSTLLLDGAAASVAGVCPPFHDELLVSMPREAAEAGNLRFLPMECPVCGHEFTFTPDALVHFCVNCHRAIGLEGETKVQIDYHRAIGEDDGCDLLPFWRFPLRIRSADGQVVTDLPHLTDGIDGTFDQIGDDAPQQQDELLVPAFHTVNPKLMSMTLNRLFNFTSNRSFDFADDRYPLDQSPRPVAATLSEKEARKLAPLYVANAFDRRDLAKVNVHQVTNWLFESELTTRGLLTYVPIPLVVSRPFRNYIGRFSPQALSAADGS